MNPVNFVLTGFAALCRKDVRKGDRYMTHYVYALTNDKAQLLVKKAEITNDEDAAQVMADVWGSQGYKVNMIVED